MEKLTATKTTLFESTPIPKAVLTLAIPTIISSLVMVIYNLADTYFVGMLNSPIQNAAVTLAAPILLAFNAVNNLFGIGSSSMMSRGLGRKDYDTVYHSSAFAFYCSIICGFLFSVLYTLFHNPVLHGLGTDADTVYATGEYLKWTVSCGSIPAILNVVTAHMVRAEGASLHASVGTISGCLLNIILDPIFIMPWGLDMGASGAGLATFISNCVACIYFFVLLYIKRGRTYVCINPKMMRSNKIVIFGILGVGIPAAIQNLLNVTGMTVLNNLSASYGADAVAAMGISQKINMVPLYIAMGLGQGIMPLVSYNYASRSTKRMKNTITFSMGIALVFMSATAVLFYVGAESLITLFMKNDVIISYGTKFLRAFCLALPFLCVDFLAVGVFQACGFGKLSLIFAILRKIVLEIPALIIWNYAHPMYGLSYAQATAEVIMAFMSVVVLIHLFHKLEKNLC